jgi:hypothetical protein
LAIPLYVLPPHPPKISNDLAEGHSVGIDRIGPGQPRARAAAPTAEEDVMAHYYDRLEAQLADLTERRAHRRRLTLRLPALRFRTEMVAVVAGGCRGRLAFLSVRTSPRPAHHAHPVGVTGSGPAVIRNFPHTRLPRPSGPVVCNADLERPGATPAVTTSPGGTAMVYSKPPPGASSRSSLRV